MDASDISGMWTSDKIISWVTEPYIAGMSEYMSLQRVTNTIYAATYMIVYVTNI